MENIYLVGRSLATARSSRTRDSRWWRKIRITMLWSWSQWYRSVRVGMLPECIPNILKDSWEHVNSIIKISWAKSPTLSSFYFMVPVWWRCWWMIMLEPTRSILMVMARRGHWAAYSWKVEEEGRFIRNRRMPEADMWSSCGRRERVRGSQDCEEMIRECIMIKMLVPRNLDRDLKLWDCLLLARLLLAGHDVEEDDKEEGV